MEHEVGAEREAFVAPRAARQVVEADPGGNVTEVAWKEGRRERSLNTLAQAQERRTRTPDVQFHALVPERREEAEPFDVVEMEVREKEVNGLRAAPDEVETESPDACSGVEHHRLFSPGQHLDAGGVAPVRD